MQPAITTVFITTGFVLCWSSGFIGGRLATEASMPTLELFAWRFLVAALLAMIWWQVMNRRRVAQPRALLREGVIGSLTIGGYLLGVMLAIELGVNAGITALIAALQPLLAAALAGRWLGEKLSVQGWFGMLIATLGVLLCVAGDIGTASDVPLWAYGLPLLSVASVTLGSLLSAHSATRLPMSATLTAQLFAATLVFGVAALIAGQGTLTRPAPDITVMAAMGWLILLSTFGGYGFFVLCLRRLGVTTTSTLVYLTPPVTLAWAALMFGDLPGTLGIAGMGIATLGVAYTLYKPKPSRHTRAPGNSPLATTLMMTKKNGS